MQSSRLRKLPENVIGLYTEVLESLHGSASGTPILVGVQKFTRSRGKVRSIPCYKVGVPRTLSLFCNGIKEPLPVCFNTHEHVLILQTSVGRWKVTVVHGYIWEGCALGTPEGIMCQRFFLAKEPSTTSKVPGYGSAVWVGPEAIDELINTILTPNQIIIVKRALGKNSTI